MESHCLMDTEFQFCKMKGSGDKSGGSYNVNVLNTIELYD